MQSELIVDIRAKKIAGAIRKIISIIQGVAIENRWLTPGGDLLAHFLQEESTIMTDDWYRFLDIRFIPAPKDVPLDGSVPAILLEVTLSSKIAKFAGEGEDRWFLRFQSHIGVDRVVFKARDAEEDKIHETVKEHLKEYGELNWPFVVYIFKAISIATTRDSVEFSKIDDFYRITGVQKNIRGYYTLDFRFIAPTDVAMLQKMINQVGEKP